MKQKKNYQGVPRLTMCRMFDQVQDLIWNFQLDEAKTILHTLPIASDCLVSLNLAEIELFKVIVSGDSRYIKVGGDGGTNSIVGADSTFRTRRQRVTWPSTVLKRQQIYLPFHLKGCI